jgi:hypothetical protein
MKHPTEQGTGKETALAIIVERRTNLLNPTIAKRRVWQMVSFAMDEIPLPPITWPPSTCQ